MKDGPDPEKVASVNAQIKAAEAALASAKANLDNLEIRATIDGAIVDMDLIVGQQVSPAQTVIELADLSELFIETDNLTEIDVVQDRRRAEGHRGSRRPAGRGNDPAWWIASPTFYEEKRGRHHLHRQDQTGQYRSPPALGG